MSDDRRTAAINRLEADITAAIAQAEPHLTHKQIVSTFDDLVGEYDLACVERDHGPQRSTRHDAGRVPE